MSHVARFQPSEPFLVIGLSLLKVDGKLCDPPASLDSANQAGYKSSNWWEQDGNAHLKFKCRYFSWAGASIVAPEFRGGPLCQRWASGSDSTGKHLIVILQQSAAGTLAVLSGMTTAQSNHSSAAFNLISGSVRKHAVITSSKRQRLCKNALHNIAESVFHISLSPLTAVKSELCVVLSKCTS